MPPTRAWLASPDAIAWQAWWNATSDEEHAVSITMLGPCRSKKYEMRLAAMLAVPPVADEASMPARS
jgi:hypothetical protein